MKLPPLTLLSLLFGVIPFSGVCSFQPTRPIRVTGSTIQSVSFSRSTRPSNKIQQTKQSSSSLKLVASPSIQLAAKAGFSAVAAQWVLARLVFSNKKCPQVLQNTADYTAHSVVALALMLLLSGLGVWNWWVNPAPIVGAARILNVSTNGKWMAAVVLGCFALWDIPISIKVKGLRKPDVIAHHCVMTLIAAIGCFLLPMEYVVYYFGIVELSSVPLIFYDQVSQWIENAPAKESEEPHPLEKIQGNLGLVAGVAFTLVRVVSFTKVTMRNFLPDCMKALTSAVGAQKWAIQFLMLACGGFTFLQWYWFSTMVKAFQEGDV